MESSWATLFFALPFIIVVSLAPVVYVAMSVFDKLIRLEYMSHREDWEADGRPWGVDWRTHSWRPPGGEMPQVSDGLWQRFLNTPDNISAARQCAWTWLFRTSAWMRQDREALRLVFKLRLLMLVFAMGNLGIFFFLGVAANLMAHLRSLNFRYQTLS